MLICFVLTTVLADIPPGAFPDPPPPKCVADSECVVSTFSCCPTCCPSEPHAALKKTKEAALCVAPSCPKLECAATACPPVQPASEYVAVCRRWASVAMPPMGLRKGTPCECPFTQVVSADAGVEFVDPATPRRYMLYGDKRHEIPKHLTCPPFPPAKKASSRCERGHCKLVTP